MNRHSPQALLIALLVSAWTLASACSKTPDGPEVSYTTINGVQCLDGAVACGADCARLDSSSQNCGSCGTVCSAGELCDLGRCVPSARGCSNPRLLCGSDCVDSASDREHCGSCDQTCPTEATCQAGSCACPGALTACGDACVDTASDEQHCGACDQACVDTQTCEAGSCQCPVGTELCTRATLAVTDNMVTSALTAAVCADTDTDGENCGSCGVQCRGGQVCEAGACGCPGGGLFCADRCVDASSDSQNCGECGQVCSGGQVCDDGACACPPGQELCGDQCVDTQSNDDHCGSCGTACGLGEGCAAGDCQSGALGEDGCEGLVSGLSISQVSVYQTVESVIARDGGAVADPTTPVVAGRPTLLRVFVTPQADWVQREVSGRLFLANGDSEETLYSTSILSPAAASQADERETTFEFLVPGADITTETRLAVELVECTAGAAGAVADARFPESDAADLEAVDTGGLRVHIVPLRANGQLPDTSEEALEMYGALFVDSYPISTIELTVGEPVDVEDPEDWGFNLDTVRAVRQRDNPPPEVYYYGMLKPADTFREFCGNGCVAGVGYIANGRQAAAGRASMGLAYADLSSAFIMLHEVGHNHGRQHAPCVPQGATINGVDPNYPDDDGGIGGFGYNALGDQLIGPEFTDLMGYCNNQWLSAYTYNALLSTIVNLNQVQASEIVDPARLGSWEVLLADEAHGLRWGTPISGTAAAMGEEEPAQILNAAGVAVQTVSVYRTRLSDLGAYSIEVPEREPGWAAIQLNGSAPVAFPSAR